MPSTQRKKEKQYGQDTLETAVKMVKAQQISLSKASVEFKIPKGTLHNKICGKTPIKCRKGPHTLLSNAEEQKLETWILNMAKVGYPVNATDVRETVTELLKIKGLKLTPGKKWMTLFLQRHQNITKRHAEIISKARASVTEGMIRKWFADLQKYLIDDNVQDLLDDPDRIYNLDETGVQLCPKTGVILAPKNYRATYNIASGQEKQSITVLCNYSASGKVVPPFIVYPLKRISKEVVQSVPDHWSIGRSDSGWMTGQTFLQYIKEIYYPWLQENNIKFPVLLLVDGHKSHINLELHEFCVEHKIILYCLQPNTTHILQPCDVGIFGPLKAAWKTAARKHKNKENIQLTRSNFAKVFAESFEKSTKEFTIKSAFKACGIFPFNVDAVDYLKCISKRQEEIYNDISVNDYKTTIDVIEKSLHENIVKKYKLYREKNKTYKSSLFKFWNKCKNRVDNLLLSQSSNIDDSLNANEISIGQEEQQRESLISTENLTINTNIMIEGILDIENMPIEIEGTDIVIDDVLGDMNELTSIITGTDQPNFIELQVPQTTSKNILDLSNSEASVSWTTAQTSSPHPSKQAIPLPWYTDGDTTTHNEHHEKNQKHRDRSIFQDLSHRSDLQNNQDTNVLFETNLHNNAMNYNEPEPGCSKTMDAKIYELLRLPERKKATKRKQSKSPVPLAITSKKFKDYLDRKELEKTKKEKEILDRKMQREQIKMEKQNKANEKKKKGKKVVTKPKTKEKNVGTFTNDTNECDERLTTNKENIDSNSYVVVEFKTNKRNRYYVGQVLMCDYEKNLVKIKCMRRKASKFDDLTYFVEPSTEDLTEVSISAITKRLPYPQIGRRGMITFENPDYDLNMCE